MRLGGTLIVRDACRLDYSVEAAVRSLVGCCDEVVVIDGRSEDGTWDLLRRIKSLKLTLYQRDWTPNRDGRWLAELTNEARSLLRKSEMHLNLQADEVLPEWQYGYLRDLAKTGKKYTMERLNFWLDPWHLLPPEEKVGQTIVRLAPVNVPSMGDAQSLEHTGAVRSDLLMFHYGFIRDAKKLALKGRELQQAFFGTQDVIWDVVEREGLAALGDSRHATAVRCEALVPYRGNHPLLVVPWLREKGFRL
jgi:hypothetical protein